MGGRLRDKSSHARWARLERRTRARIAALGRRASVMSKACLQHHAPPRGGALVRLGDPVILWRGLAGIKRFGSEVAAPPRASELVRLRLALEKLLNESGIAFVQVSP